MLGRERIKSLEPVHFPCRGTIFPIPMSKAMLLYMFKSPCYFLLCLYLLLSILSCESKLSLITNCKSLTGAPGCINDSLLTGLQFVEGFESYFFVSRWSMHQLVSSQSTIDIYQFSSSCAVDVLKMQSLSDCSIQSPLSTFLLTYSELSCN